MSDITINDPDFDMWRGLGSLKHPRQEKTVSTTTDVPRIVGADSEVSRCWSRDYRDFTPDPTDVELLAERQTKRLANPRALEGDWVEFDDFVTRRISHVWPEHVQTSDGGSWHISRSGCGSFSGGLYPGVPQSSLTDTKTLRPARFWFFHRDMGRAHHGVYADVNVRVWRCSLPAPR
jgi:hypothetical protein